MTNEQILKKAIEKAVKNGWKQKNKYNHLFTMMDLFSDTGKFFKMNDYFPIIFSHDFAKAFWGDKFVPTENTSEPYIIWKHHLSNMVLEQEPLKYIKKFL